MGYKYIRDIHIEEPFYHTMARKLNGIKIREPFNGKASYEVSCPCCKKRKARMGYSNHKDTFILVCPVDTCSLRRLVLHDLIKRFGGESMFNEWRKASWTTTYEENWFPIQNKVAYKDRAPRKKKTFKDKQELKSAALSIKMNSTFKN
tara:strand:- start:50 stop:493 length:444 start_codon:yes stop_codon:yes gene_type:complete